MVKAAAKIGDIPQCLSGVLLAPVVKTDKEKSSNGVGGIHRGLDDLAALGKALNNKLINCILSGETSTRVDVTPIYSITKNGLNVHVIEQKECI